MGRREGRKWVGTVKDEKGARNEGKHMRRGIRGMGRRGEGKTSTKYFPVQLAQMKHSYYDVVFSASAGHAHSRLVQNMATSCEVLAYSRTCGVTTKTNDEMMGGTTWKARKVKARCRMTRTVQWPDIGRAYYRFWSTAHQQSTTLLRAKGRR